MVVMLVDQIRSRQTKVGARKLQKMLANPRYGLPVNIGRDSLFRLLRKYGKLSKLHKCYKKTTNSSHQFQIYPNLVKGLSIQLANQVWVSDITYLKLAKGKFCYLFLVSDLYSRKILGFALKESLATEGAEEALQMAIDFAKPKTGLIHHSDHGIQYCSKSYVALLQKHGALISMTGENHCYDNAVAERINGILKQEYGLGSALSSFDAAKLLSSDGIHIYNSERLHTVLGYRTPNEMYDNSINSMKESA